jgi:hypothetical protein
LRLDSLLENRALDRSILAASGLAVLPFVYRPLGRLLGVARLEPQDAAVALAAAIFPAAAALARRGIELDLTTVEGRSCETS